MEISQANFNDRRALSDLRYEWRHDHMAANMYFNSPQRLINSTVARVSSEVVGFIEGHHFQTEIWKPLREFEMKPNGWKCSYLDQLYVTPPHRRQGIGESLIQAFEDAARHAGNDVVVLNPDASSPGLEEYLKTYYGKFGYRLAEFIDSRPAYLLTKNLES